MDSFVERHYVVYLSSPRGHQGLVSLEEEIWKDGQTALIPILLKYNRNKHSLTQLISIDVPEELRRGLARRVHRNLLRPVGTHLIVTWTRI